MKTVSEAIKYFSNDVQADDILTGNTNEEDFPFVEAFNSSKNEEDYGEYFVYKCSDGFVGVELYEKGTFIRVKNVLEFVEYTYTLKGYRPKTEND